MAVFVAAADESLSVTSGDFYFGGFVAPEREWDEFFAPAWEHDVLNAHPSIPYLHVTDLKSERGRRQFGLTEEDAERKLDEAFRVIRCQGALVPVAVHLNAEHFRSAMQGGNVKMKIRTPGGMAEKPFDPDYICFLRFAMTVLFHVSENHPDAEKVDFVVEVNGQITRHIQRFHKSIPKGLRDAGMPALAALVGDLIPGNKIRVPLQAADLLCWYARNRNTLNRADSRRYASLTGRRGFMSHASEDHINGLVERATRDSRDGFITDADDDEDAASA